MYMYTCIHYEHMNMFVQVCEHLCPSHPPPSPFASLCAREEKKSEVLAVALSRSLSPCLSLYLSLSLSACASPALSLFLPDCVCARVGGDVRDP